MIIKADDKWTKWDDFKIWLEYTFPFRQLSDMRYYLKNLIFRRHHLINTRLKKGQWYDTDARMLYGNMNLLMDYFEKEKPFDIINWDSDKEHASARDEMIAIRDWWLDYDNRGKEIEDVLTEWHDTKFKDCPRDGWLDRINTADTKEEKDLFDGLHNLEAKLKKEEEEMLVRLIKIREFLWT